SGKDGAGDGVALHDAAKDVDQHGLNPGIGEQDAERFRHLVLVSAAADVKKVGRFASVELDDVHRAHGQPGAVDQAADIAIQTDETESGARGPQLAGVFLGLVTKLFDVRMTEESIV